MLNRLPKGTIGNVVTKELDTEIAIRYIINNEYRPIEKMDHSVGIYYNNLLTGVMAFTCCKPGVWVLCHYTLVVTMRGCLSKLFSLFCNKQQPTTVIGYSNLMLNTDELYKEIGFKLIEKTSPTKKYTTNYKDFSSTCKSINGDSIWDCGTNIWVYNR